MLLSLHFGMYFWLDDDDDFCYCPANSDGTADSDSWGYVSEWDDFDGVDFDKLFTIHRHLVTDKVTEYEREKVQAQPGLQTGTKSLDFCAILWHYNNMNNSDFNEFYPQLAQKGYDMSDLSGAMEAAISQEVPAAFKDRYSTYEEYSEAIHEFLNGL